MKNKQQIQILAYKPIFVKSLLGWLVLYVNMARLCCPDVWSNPSIDVAVKESLDVVNI